MLLGMMSFSLYPALHTHTQTALSAPIGTRRVSGMWPVRPPHATVCAKATLCAQRGALASSQHSEPRTAGEDIGSQCVSLLAPSASPSQAPSVVPSLAPSAASPTQPGETLAPSPAPTDAGRSGRDAPFIAATIARAIPVLPDVASMSVSPGLMRPEASACWIMLSAGRSFTEPARTNHPRASPLSDCIRRIAAPSFRSVPLRREHVGDHAPAGLVPSNLQRITYTHVTAALSRRAVVVKRTRPAGKEGRRTLVVMPGSRCKRTSGVLPTSCSMVGYSSPALRPEPVSTAAA
jgi:hypothetical protein